MTRHPALVGIVPRKNLWDTIQKQKWYHIPVESAPRNVELIEYLGFYFPNIFGKEMRYKVNFYAKVRKVDIAKRVELFPEEKSHFRANRDYFQFHLESIKELPKPIPSKEWRRIVHIPTSRQKMFNAEEINDLWDTSPLEEKMYREMKRREIEAERQFYVRAGNQWYCLDFGIFCLKGNIDVECDGERYHTLPNALARDRERNNRLTSYDWRVLRFSGREINYGLQDCFKIIRKTIDTLGGLVRLKEFK